MHLLLEAALLEKEKALISWAQYLRQNDLQKISHGEASILPFVYRNLKEKSHPLCKSIYRHTWAANQTLWNQIQPLLHQFLCAGIEKIIVLKGMALILEHYRDFGCRTLGDIDILMDRAHLFAAYSILIENGWTCKVSVRDLQNPHVLARWHAAHFTHASGLHLDLHWSFLLEGNAFLDTELLRVSPLGIHAAPPTFLLLQACVHGNKKSSAPLIRWIPDAMILLESPIDFPYLFHLAQSCFLSAPLLYGLRFLLHHFNASIPPLPLSPTPIERAEFQANMRGRPYLAGYYRARLRNQSVFDYLQHTARLSSPWLIPFYAPFWAVKRLYRYFLRLV